MAYTPLEKIVLAVFEYFDKKFAERLFHSQNPPVHNGKRLRLGLPWFIADDKEFLEFLNEPAFFYRCIHTGMTTEYVVSPLFYTLAKHDSGCKDTKTCQHTKDLMLDFMTKPEAEQESIIDDLLEKNLYEDRLQFLLSNKISSAYILGISSEATALIDNAGDYVVAAGLGYKIIKGVGLNKISKSAQKKFSNIEILFEENIARHEIDEYWVLSSLIKDIIETEYIEKKNG